MAHHAVTFLFCLGLYLAGPAPNGFVAAANISTASTVMPTVHVLPPYGHFNLSEDGKICLLLNLQSTITVAYGLKNKSSTTTVQYFVPSNAKSSGTCGKSVDLTWPSADKRATLVLSMYFEDSSKDTWSSSRVAFHATSLNLTNPLVDGGLLSNLSAVSSKGDKLPVNAKVGHSYKCMKTKTVQLGSAVRVSYMKIQVQPSGEIFGEADICSMSSGGNPAGAAQDTIVPIAVGCALLGMVVILIITYIVGRAQRSGYEKM